VEHCFDFLETTPDIRRWATTHFRLLYGELEYKGIVLSDPIPCLALSFDSRIPIIVRRRQKYWSSETQAHEEDSVGIDVRLPLGDVVHMDLARNADVKTVLGHVMNDFDGSGFFSGVPPIMLTWDGWRLAASDRVWGMTLPLVAAKPIGLVDILNEDNPADHILFPCLFGDTVDHLSDFVTCERATTNTRFLIFLNGREVSGRLNVPRLLGPTSRLTFRCSTPPDTGLRFTATFDPARPFDSGIIGGLRMREFRFSPRVILSQSTNNVSSIIDPDSADAYISHARGAATIDLFFAEDITLTRIVIETGTISIPRGLSLTAIRASSQAEMIGDLYIPNPRRGQDFEFCFPAATARLFRISQTAPNGYGKHCIRLQRIECFSPDPRFQEGVFRQLFRKNREEVRGYIEVTAKFNQPDQLYRMDDAFNSCTENKPYHHPWVQVELTKGQLQVSGYALRRRMKMELRTWSLRASNDSSQPLDEWTVLHGISRCAPNSVTPIDFFEIRADLPFTIFRLVSEDSRWDGKPALHIDGFELFGTYTEH
jgi:hypothetical protein